MVGPPAFLSWFRCSCNSRTSPRRPSSLALVAVIASSLCPRSALAGTVVINEISDQGTPGTGNCGKYDWVELYHIPYDDSDVDPLSLGGYLLHDDKGPDDPDAFMFPRGDVDVLSSILPGQYLVLCAGPKDATSLPQFKLGGSFLESANGEGSGTFLTSIGPTFRIGQTDTITLLDVNGAVVSLVGDLPGTGAEGRTYIRLSDGSGDYDYTSRPTPGSQNEFVSIDETAEDRRERMRAQNAIGKRFFGMDDKGMFVQDAFEHIVDLQIDMEEADFEDMMAHRMRRTYKPFKSARVLSRSTGEKLLTLSSPGRIRTKGAWSLMYASCVGFDAVPFSLDFDSIDSSQTLFGTGTVYLRNHIADLSYMREWAQHRMLARFGLPHLRTRKARFFVNGALLGLYDLMEAPTQEYVFARSFPDYNPSDYALYKVKTASLGCGTSSVYTPENIASARREVENEDPSVPTEPYAWERGDHQPDVLVYGIDRYEECINDFREHYEREGVDTVLAYVRHGEDCPEMVMEEGLIDRDLGTPSWDEKAKEFYRNHLGSFRCSSAEECAESGLPFDVDLENILKVMAFYAVTINMDSPMQGGKNYYLANDASGDEKWRIVPYDVDSTISRNSASICGEKCMSTMVDWSILRPTCRGVESSQLVGPLLSRPHLMERYVGYVSEFVEEVFANEDVIRQMEDHARAIQSDVEKDPFSIAYWHDYSTEMSPDAVSWDSHWMTPLLPVMKARTEAVRAQLDAMNPAKGGRYSVIAAVDRYEKCTRWQDVPTSLCFMGCRYSGCYEPTWTVPGYCDENDGTCYHGVKDELCEGVANGEQYNNMEPFYEGDNAPYCWDGRKTAVCIAPGSEQEEGPSTDSTTAVPPPEKGGTDDVMTSTSTTTMPISACYKNCMYDGCYQPSWSLPASCNEVTRLCIHGDHDERCVDVQNGLRYDDMEPLIKGEAMFCWDGLAESVCMSEEDYSSVSILPTHPVKENTTEPPNPEINVDHSNEDESHTNKDEDKRPEDEKTQEDNSDVTMENIEGEALASDSTDYIDDPGGSIPEGKTDEDAKAEDNHVGVYFSCHKSCQYDGCHQPSWTIPSQCDEERGICYHGNYDSSCIGVKNGHQYVGMTSWNKNEPVYCWDEVAVSACLMESFYDRLSNTSQADVKNQSLPRKISAGNMIPFSIWMQGLTIMIPLAFS